jgi:hypothetical protein
MVTVTVADSDAPSDKASTSFLLTVISDGVTPAAPPVHQQTPFIPAKKGGGSMGWLVLLGLGLLSLRVKRT